LANHVVAGEEESGGPHPPDADDDNKIRDRVAGSIGIGLALAGHTVDAAMAKRVHAGQGSSVGAFKLEVLADDRRMPGIALRPVIALGQQFAIFVHSVDSGRGAGVTAGEDGGEFVPAVAADGHGIRNIADASLFIIGKQLAHLIHGVDAVLVQQILAGEDEFEFVPAISATDHGIRDVAGDSVIGVGKQLARLVYGVDAAGAGANRNRNSLHRCSRPSQTP
jgi:hypothetical protein